MAYTRREFLRTSAAMVASTTLGGDVGGADGKTKPKFQLGLVTYNVAATWDLPTIIKVCQQVGIAAVELRTTHKHGVEPTLNKGQRKEVRQRFADSGVVLWGCGTTCEFHSPDVAEVKRQIETCKRFVELVADVGGKGVKVRPNRLVPNVPAEKTLTQIGQSLLPCGKAAQDAGVEIWVEVHGRGTSEPENVKKIMEHCGHPKVGLCWNCNPPDVKNGSVADSFKMLRRWLLSCHINSLYNDSLGVYPYRELFRLLTASGYDRYTLCEVGRLRPDPASGAEFLRYYKALWQELARP
ncbi:MAG: hypothetical protein KatS3mg105_0541 [Gemmatales bacterium]|nr:MAG: hypothetical protein KatS3mg105_0541 [Gemmatales bacterium]